jgi:hypothetical protein
MSLKVEVEKTLLRAFRQEVIKETESGGFKINVLAIGNDEIDTLNDVKNMGTIDVNIKRSGTGLCILIS